MDAADLLKVVREIRVETEWGPPVVIRDPFSPSPEPSSGGQIVALLKPKITVVTDLGTKTVEPWGEPGPTRWNQLLTAGAVVAAALAAMWVVGKL